MNMIKKTPPKSIAKYHDLRIDFKGLQKRSKLKTLKSRTQPMSLNISSKCNHSVYLIGLMSGLSEIKH